MNTPRVYRVLTPAFIRRQARRRSFVDKAMVRKAAGRQPLPKRKAA